MCNNTCKSVRKSILKNTRVSQYIPESDYISNISGVYYHFGKLEWRSICHDPNNRSKRWQKTFSVRKYGFYSAKALAELTSLKSLKESNQSSTNHRIEIIKNNHQKDMLRTTNFFIPQKNIPQDYLYNNIEYVNYYYTHPYMDTILPYDVGNIHTLQPSTYLR